MVETVERGDEDARAELLEQARAYRGELLAHCYRMLGSVHDAEDLVQETYLRAWRAGTRFEGRSSLRTWLYRIATNACLTALAQRGRRPLPTGLGGPVEDPEQPVVAVPEVPWLEPAPDALFTGAGGGDPASVVAGRSSMRLALVAALQYLPGRQRAVLLLREVLGWRAAEVAELLETSTAAVNSALQRARSQLATLHPVEEEIAEPTEPALRERLERYAAAFEAADVPAIVDLFEEEVVWEMPPYPEWVSGRTALLRLIAAQCPIGPSEGAMLATAANGQPAFGLYRRGKDGRHLPFHLQVLTLRGGRIAHVAAFFDARLFPLCGLPAALDAERRPLPASAVEGA